MCSQVCGVAILRAGEVLEPAFLSVCKDATIGKILIQTNQGTREPELHFLRLPQNIADCHVVLMDATIATGAAAIMAIRVLLVRVLCIMSASIEQLTEILHKREYQTCIQLINAIIIMRLSHVGGI